MTRYSRILVYVDVDHTCVCEYVTSISRIYMMVRVYDKYLCVFMTVITNVRCGFSAFKRAIHYLQPTTSSRPLNLHLRRLLRSTTMAFVI